LFCSSNAEFYRNLTAQPTTTVNQFFGHEVDNGSHTAVHQQDECSALNCEFHSAASLLSGVCGEFWTSSEPYDVLDYFSGEPNNAHPLLFDECGWQITFDDFLRPGFAKHGCLLEEVSSLIICIYDEK